MKKFGLEVVKYMNDWNSEKEKKFVKAVLIAVCILVILAAIIMKIIIL